MTKSNVLVIFMDFTVLQVVVAENDVCEASEGVISEREFKI